MDWDYNPVQIPTGWKENKLMKSLFSNSVQDVKLQQISQKFRDRQEHWHVDKRFIGDAHSDKCLRRNNVNVWCLRNQLH